VVFIAAPLFFYNTLAYIEKLFKFVKNHTKMDIKTLYNKSLITYEICEDVLNRTAFYKPSEYELRLEDGKIILDIFSQPSTTEYDLESHHLGI
jgi:hypothetical protein